MGHQGPGLRLREVTVRSILSRSRLADYCLNPYAGCEHACVYCYARFATRFSHPNDEWGSFVDIRTNAPRLIEEEAARKRPGKVVISSVSDGWQPQEQKYRLTRQCLQVLLDHNYAVFIQTKSALVQRDFDLIEGHPNVEFGMTITTVEPKVADLFEPRASAPDVRIGVLSKAGGIGIRTFIFLGPLLPYISDRGKGLMDLLDVVAEINPDYFLVDRLNPRYGVWRTVSATLSKYDPELIPEYRKILYDRPARGWYTFKLRQRIRDQAKQRGLVSKMRLCF
jgi:DNA repair photolyase